VIVGLFIFLPEGMRAALCYLEISGRRKVR
jgi:hypothetical protein